MKEWAKEFYHSKEWRSTRKKFLYSRQNVCERCGEIAKIAHHKIYLTRYNINNLEISLNWDNLEALCQECHNTEHLKKIKKRRYSFDNEGNLILNANESAGNSHNIPPP